jgi:type IV pilus assembly protein PilB
MGLPERTTTPETAEDILVQRGLLTADQVKVAQDGGIFSGRDVLDQMVFAGQISEQQLVECFSKHFSIPAMKLTSINTQVLDHTPLDAIVKSHSIPYAVDASGSICIAIAYPRSLAYLESFKTTFGRPVLPMFTTLSSLNAAIQRISEMKKATQEKPKAPVATTPPPAAVPAQANPATPSKPTLVKSSVTGQTIRKFRSADPVSNILDQVLGDAVAKGASDVHIEPQANFIAVRFRFEGVLFDVYEIPNELKEQLSNRVKITAGLDIAERRIPQDGRARLKVATGEVSFRTSVMPSFYGETIVFRLLRQNDLQLDVAKLGFDEKQLAAFRRGIEAPNGMTLITGPTGSGKTTTLYTALSALNERSVKIATVEDPVEYNLSGITQIQVNRDAGLGFAEILKSMLRQDPDVILVGEIRDGETAAITVQAALTGHLVLSSLHTNDAASAVLRLLNMKVEPFAVLAATTTVVAQRLIRKVCTHCAEPVTLAEEQLKWLGNDRTIVEGGTHLKGRGCEKCLGGGYRGRQAIYEVLELDDGVKEMFLKGSNVIEIKRHAISAGMKTLRQSALQLVTTGVTTLEEAIASTLER